MLTSRQARPPCGHARGFAERRSAAPPLAWRRWPDPAGPGPPVHRSRSMRVRTRAKSPQRCRGADRVYAAGAAVPTPRPAVVHLGPAPSTARALVAPPPASRATLKRWTERDSADRGAAHGAARGRSCAAPWSRLSAWRRRCSRLRQGPPRRPRMRPRRHPAPASRHPVPGTRGRSCRHPRSRRGFGPHRIDTVLVTAASTLWAPPASPCSRRAPAPSCSPGRSAAGAWCRCATTTACARRTSRSGPRCRRAPPSARAT
jgi:hypothetical protein